MASLNLKDIERGLGGDLFRRPIVTSVLNALMLRFFLDNIFEFPDITDPDQAQREHQRKSVFFDLDPPKPGTYDYEQLQRAQKKQNMSEHAFASLLFISTHLVLCLGFAETLAWLVVAVCFKLLGLPKIYVFEKLLLDIRVTLLPRSVRHIDKNVQLVSYVASSAPQFTVVRRGLPFMGITIITASQTLTRDSETMLRLLRFNNHISVTFFTSDTAVLVGRNQYLVDVLCRTETTPTMVDLGWHKDAIENTTYRMSVTFQNELLTPDVENNDSPVITAQSDSDSQRDTDSNLITGSTSIAVPYGQDVEQSLYLEHPSHAQSAPSPVRACNRQMVKIQMKAQSTTRNLEMLLLSMDQFASVCEAPELGKRQFNGKRFAIFFVGVVAAVLLVLFYQDYELKKPEVDLLTLGFGVYTLWMTVGKSAVFGEVEEDTSLNLVTRQNILLAFHGLAAIPNNVVNVCWVPEVYRRDRGEPPKGAEVMDGSISVLEAAIFLNIFVHYGHFIKWKGSRLVLDRYDIVEDYGDGESEADALAKKYGIGHVVAVDRFQRLSQLKYCGESTTLQRIGADGQGSRRHVRGWR